MSRKSLIICLAALAVMILGIAVAVAFLYSGTDGGMFRKSKVVPDEGRYLLLPAVPADAVFVACFSDSDAASYALPDDFPHVPSRLAVSLHYNGDLQALYVFDAGRASAGPSEVSARLADYAAAAGMSCEFVDGSDAADGSRDVSRRSLVLMSKSENLVKSSRRHLEKSISIMDAAGFYEASSAVPGENVMFFSNAHARSLMAGMFSGRLAGSHPFITSFSTWTVAEVMKADEAGLNMNICPVFDGNASEYMNVLANSGQGTSEISQILPAYTVSALSLPMNESELYIAEYQRYMDSKQSLHSFRNNQKRLETRAGISPDEFFRRLDVKEVGKASFILGGRLEEVNLMRIGREDTIVFVGTKIESFKDYTPSVHSWPYESFISSVFGKYFKLEKESCFTYIDGWIISGNEDAVQHYADGKALAYRLVEYMEDAGQKDMLSADAVMTIYHSFTEDPDRSAAMFSRKFAGILEPFHSGCDYCPVVMTMTRGKNAMKMNVRMPKLTLSKTKAPEFVRDTTVTVPAGPFRVKNSGTGRMNLFGQNRHGALCLTEEDGKGIWGVPFKGKMTGTAYNVDHFANGKLQIIFGSGSSIYLIDRLGRFVSGFPVDLGREILLGPDIYDFNNKKAYNIMVLHTDNTIEMYNLKGRRPSSWTTIKAPETVKALPERIKVGGSTFWVVRTAIQTLIYPFGGGQALTTFEGDQMIRPDSGIEILDGTSVSVECYDGKTRTVRLK